MPNLMPVLPEIFLMTAACFILIADRFLNDSNRDISYLMTQATLVGATILTVMLHTEATTFTFSGQFISDKMSDVLKVFVYLVTSVVFLYSREYSKSRGLFRGEYFVLGLFAVLGMMIMISAYNMLVLYLGLELLSLCLYAMVALQRDSRSATEAAMKYFVLGSMASGMLLYGMSIIYGATGSLDIAVIAVEITQTSFDSNVLSLGMVFIIIGLAFKLGAVPFHMWVPDVYQGAPTSVTLFISTAPKIAAFAMVIRLLTEGLGDLQSQWQEILIILAVLSIGVGNLVAIAQGNIKRMLAYSTIAHVGFLLLGIISGTNEGYAASMFYIIVYAIMGLGGFGMIILLSRQGYEADNINAFKGLNERSPWFAFMMLIFMLSMAGVPPFLGFWAKLSVLKAVVDGGMIWLALFAVVFAIIGAYYYLRIIWYMYFAHPEDENKIEAKIDMRVALSVNGISILLLGIYPTALMALCAQSFL